MRFDPRSRLLGPSARVSQWMTRSYIKSIQRFSITVTAGNLTATATITAVDTNNTRLVWQGSTYNTAASTNMQEAWAYLTLTNSTTVTATRDNTGNACTAAGSAIEYYPGVWKSIQRGTFQITGTNTSGTGTITAVDINKADVECLGSMNQSITGAFSENLVTVVMTNATTLTATRGTAPGGADPITISYQVPEPY